MISQIIHVARDGVQIGQYGIEELLSLLDTGSLRSTDLCYSADVPEWTPISRYLEIRKLHTSSSADELAFPSEQPSGVGEEGAVASKESDVQAVPRRSRSSRHERQNRFLSMLGWVCFLLAGALLVGAGFWISSLYDEIENTKATVARAQEEVAAITKENQRLIFAGTEVSQLGKIRGRLLFRGPSGARQSIPGTQVSLFPRRALEDYLDAAVRKLRDESPSGEIPTATLLAGLPKPQASTLTDSNGRFQFDVPKEGSFVVCTLLATGTLQEKLWLVGFDSADPMNLELILDESNVVSQFVPGLMISEGR